MEFIRKALVVLILSMAIVSGLAVVPFYGKVATVEAGIVGKAAKAYLSSRLIKAMFINGSKFLRQRAADQFFAAVKREPSLAPEALRMIQAFAKSPKITQHLSGPRGAELTSEIRTAIIRLKAWNKPSLPAGHPLKGTIDGLYRTPSNLARVGSGNSADALRYERMTGQLVGGKGHAQKVDDAITSIRGWLNKPQNVRPDQAEYQSVKNVLDDLLNAAGR